MHAHAPRRAHPRPSSKGNTPIHPSFVNVVGDADQAEWRTGTSTTPPPPRHNHLHHLPPPSPHHHRSGTGPRRHARTPRSDQQVNPQLAPHPIRTKFSIYLISQLAPHPVLDALPRVPDTLVGFRLARVPGSKAPAFMPAHACAPVPLLCAWPMPVRMFRYCNDIRYCVRAHACADARA